MNTKIQQENILPPQAPTIEQEINIENTTQEETIVDILIRQKITSNVLSTDGTFIPGRFDYVKNKKVREMFATAWQAINMTEGWHFMSQPIDSFMWSDDEQLKKINNKLHELYDGHSGCTYGYTMREMQSIARCGEIQYKKNNKN
jgi:hypothetical protein